MLDPEGERFEPRFSFEEPQQHGGLGSIGPYFYDAPVAPDLVAPVGAVNSLGRICSSKTRTPNC